MIPATCAEFGNVAFWETAEAGIWVETFSSNWREVFSMHCPLFNFLGPIPVPCQLVASFGNDVKFYLGFRHRGARVAHSAPDWVKRTCLHWRVRFSWDYQVGEGALIAYHSAGNMTFADTLCLCLTARVVASKEATAEFATTRHRNMWEL